MEYLSDELGENLSEEIVLGDPQQLRRVALAQAQAKDYVREIQVRLLVQPLLERLCAELGANAQIEAHLLRQLSQFRAEDAATQGYGPANVITLLKALQGHLRGLDLSRLVLRGVYLQGVELQDANLSGALLQESVFPQTFDAINAVAISSSGQYWAAGRRGEVWLWREAGQSLHLVWRAHTDTVWGLAFSPHERTLASGSLDGSRLSSTSWDGTLKLWDLASGRCLQTLEEHTERVQALAWSPDGGTLASGSFDHTIRLWDGQEGTVRAVLQGHSTVVYGLAFTPDSRHVLSGGDDGTLRLWEVQRGQGVRV